VRVTVTDGGRESSELIPGAAAVWSSSPSSLLVLDRRLRSTGRSETAVATLPAGGAGFGTGVVRLARTGTRRVRGDSGWIEVEVLGVDDGSGTREALVRGDLPLACAGWFELAA